MASSDLSAVAVGDDDKRHIFPFFDLPQELRDEVYDLSLASRSASLDIGFDLKAESVPTIDLLLVSKNLKDEYQLRARKNSKVTITDSGAWTYEMWTEVPLALSNATTILVQIVCSCESDVETHKRWICDFTQTLKHPSAFSIRVNHYHPLATLKEVCSVYRTWTTLKGLNSLKVYHIADAIAERIVDMSSEEGPHLEWTSTTGEFEEVTTKAQAAEGEV